MAEKEERQREAQERKALEHKAKVKAANERRAAVRANAEALAKKQEAEKLKKVSSLFLILFMIVQKDTFTNFNQGKRQTSLTGHETEVRASRVFI